MLYVARIYLRSLERYGPLKNTSFRGVGRGGQRGHLPPPFFFQKYKAKHHACPHFSTDKALFRTLTVVKVALVVLRAGKDDREAVYKAISFQTSHREAFYFVASPKVTLISGRGFRSKNFPRASHAILYFAPPFLKSWLRP